MSPTILITRPEPAATLFADQLRARLGCAVPILLSPLMRIEPCGDAPDLSAARTLIFTSRNGVAAFADRTPRRDIACYCVGDATATRAREEGFEATSCAGTADDVVARIIADGITGPCLHIRGEHGAGDITSRLNLAGISTDQTVLYRQAGQPLSDDAQALLQRDDPVIVPLFSPRTARLLFEDSTINAPLTVVALSANVAKQVPKTHSDRVLVAETPDKGAMVRAILGVF